MATSRQGLRERRGRLWGSMDVGTVLGGSVRAIAANAGAFVGECRDGAEALTKIETEKTIIVDCRLQIADCRMKIGRP